MLAECYFGHAQQHDWEHAPKEAWSDSIPYIKQVMTDCAYLYVMDRMYALCNKLRTRCNNSDEMENELHHTCHATLAHS